MCACLPRQGGHGGSCHRRCGRSPEALDGGAIALVEDGDEIHIDLSKNLIQLNVSDEELDRRRAAWKPVIRENGGHLLKRYAEQVDTAKTGAVLR